MTISSKTLSSTAIAAALSIPLALGPAWAQDSQATDQSNSQTNTPEQQANEAGSGNQSSSGASQQGGQASAEASGSSADAQANAVVATVDGNEIRGSDLLTVIGALPPQLRSQPPQMLVPLALDQLIMRQLILQKARQANLTQDPEVQSLVSGATQTAEDDALVQVWLDRELQKSVTDEAVQQSYDAAQAQGQTDLPPLEAVRPQIEQHLRRQAVEELRTQLREGADIVLFDPTGQPIESTQQASQSGGDSSSGSNGGNGQSSGSNGQNANAEAARGQAEQAGMQQVQPMQGTTVLRGKSENQADVFMIVGPSGELLALAAPLPEQSGDSGNGSSPEASAQDSPDTPPEAGEPAESGFMATQAQPASPNMWDPATVEQGMRQLELGTRGAAGEVGNP
ncbi:hypothetical protein [Paracoccus rhizosphaerae]|uniref:Peptidyl-prolyl cis-trans isomerase SurA n=2 Tax=Paracoccus rhizosphaerae TaxID=1133347 RepID=A0ABV6CRU3_9RHOB